MISITDILRSTLKICILGLVDVSYLSVNYLSLELTLGGINLPRLASCVDPLLPIF